MHRFQGMLHCFGCIQPKFLRGLAFWGAAPTLARMPALPDGAAEDPTHARLRGPNHRRLKHFAASLHLDSHLQRARGGSPGS